MTLRHFWLACALVAGCGKDPEPERDPINLTAGAPIAGVAEVNIDFPMGAPMGGYSNRCDYLGRSGSVDNRRSPYTVSWSSSSGIQTRARAQVLWLNNGDQDVVLIKADVIYAFDNLVRTLEKTLSERTGRDLEGRVVLTTSHTHNAPANYSDSFHFYLGGDRYNEEVFQRFHASLADAAMSAWDSKQAVSVGMGVMDDWDPSDLVYSDRRVENDTLQVWDDQPAGKRKDPRLWLIRVDALDGSPLGVFFNFGIHGTVLGSENAMVSTEASGHIEYALADRFESPVVVAHWQGSGGDQSPRGTDDEYARMETIGLYAADAIYDLWEATPTSSSPLLLETVTRSIPEGLEEIRVSRGGSVDWYYLPYDIDREPDLEIYGSDGEILSPIDEFNAQYGGAFCGYDEPLVSVGTIGTEVYPYDGCMDVELMSWVIAGVFGLGADSVPLPLPSSQAAMTASTRLGPIPILQPDGTVTTDDAFLGFFPGETTQMYTEQFQRRAEAELGLENVFVTGYAQDHEGYLLIPEDWLVGGYEPNINIWGPLQGEHIMEGNLDMMASNLLTNLLEPHDPLGEFPDTSYPDHALEPTNPDTTPDAGTVPDSIPDYLWTPLEVTPQLQPDVTVPRVQGLAQFVWKGGDPAVDVPRVVLERRDGDTWVEVTTDAGFTVSDTLPDIITAHTPDPLYPHDVAQTHYWWAAWQAVPHSGSRTAMPEGEYRFQVYGNLIDGASDVWPYDTVEYRLASEPFEVVPAEITVELVEDGVRASIAGPSFGYRLVDLAGYSRGANPARDATLTWHFEDGSSEADSVEATVTDRYVHFGTSVPEGAVAAEISDPDGNTGMLELE